MRRFWLSVLLTIALGVGNVAGASAAQDCPMQRAAAASHDCCPDDAGSNAPNGPEKPDIGACVLGMACRPAPAITPAVTPVLAAAAALDVSQPNLGDAAPPSGPLQELFRPPRSI